MHDADSIEKVLRQWGIHRGFPEQRRLLVLKLVTRITELTDHACETLFLEARDGLCKDKPAPVVAGWLHDGTWEERLRDINSSDEHVAKRTDRPEGKPRNWMPEHEATPEWKQRHQEMWAYVRLAFDRKPLNQVCNEMNLAEFSVVQLARKGCVLYQRDPDTCELLKRAIDPHFAESDTARRRDEFDDFRRSRHPPDPNRPLEAMLGSIVDNATTRVRDRDADAASGAPDSIGLADRGEASDPLSQLDDDPLGAL